MSESLSHSPLRSAPRASARSRLLLAGLGFTLLLLVAGWFMPKWLTFLLTMAASHGLVSLGIVLLMRGGVVSFGQGLVFAVGGYAAALGFARLGLTDAVGLTLMGGAAAVLVAAGVGMQRQWRAVRAEQRFRRRFPAGPDGVVIGAQART